MGSKFANASVSLDSLVAGIFFNVVCKGSVFGNSYSLDHCNLVGFMPVPATIKDDSVVNVINILLSVQHDNKCYPVGMI